MQSHSPEATLPLLHIDDRATERRLVRQAIFLSNTPFAFYEADGIESAMPFFQSDQTSHPAAQSSYPALVLLDYDMGSHTGLDFLFWLRVMKKITAVPVVMFSSSTGPRQLVECYSAGADFFLTRPNDLSRIKVIIGALHQWLVSTQPPNPILALPEYLPDPRTAGRQVRAI